MTALGRPTFTGFNRTGSPGSYAYESSITATYDAANRLLTAVGSAAGTITLTWDDLDRLTGEASPQGTMAWAYDAASRRTSATLAGQAAVTYGYDAADLDKRTSERTLGNHEDRTDHRIAPASR
jgi:YD repeat-containing protein